MTSPHSVNPSSYPSRRRVRRRQQRQLERRRFLTGSLILVVGGLLAFLYTSPPSPEALKSKAVQRFFTANPVSRPLPLAMQGGDPYIRALMRTISASESNSDQPYAMLYGGDLIQNFNHHPDRCLTIAVGPNIGNCTTAAGRYQFLTTTWKEKAELYHPQPPAWYTPWSTYSFEPEYQDQVVYAWLSDPYAWGGYDISALLQQGEIYQVLELLSGTWTSLGYGIESNSMTSALPDIYWDVLQEELALAGYTP
ncbi:MAG: glycoside hydrolase family 24 protein [Thainema sp.]